MKQRDWIMSDKEITRLEVIKECLEKRLMQAAGAAMLGISERHFRYILSEYRKHQLAGIVSKRRGRPSNNKIDDKIRNQALELVREHYPDFGATFAHEKLFANHSLVLLRGRDHF